MPSLMEKDVEELLARKASAERIRAGYEDQWEEMLELMAPNIGDITTKESEEGHVRVNSVLNSRAMLAADRLANWLKSALFPSNTDWVRFQVPKGLDDAPELKRLLDVTTERILTAMESSNFYTTALQHLRTLVVTGNAVTLVEENGGLQREWGGLHYESIHIANMWWTIGKGDVRFCVRKYKMPLVEAIEFFGPHPKLVQLGDGMNAMKPVEFFQFVYKNEGRMPGGIPAKTRLPWVSDWIMTHKETDGPFRLRQRGYLFNPYVISRWEVVDGETYGRGRGNLARADTLGVNELDRQVYIAAGRELNPPVVLENEASIQLNSAPFGVTIMEPGSQPPSFLKSGTDLNFALAIRALNEDAIDKAFLGHLIDEPDTETRSAEAERSRQARLAQALASPSEMLDHEYLTPEVMGTTELMLSRNQLPELEEYISRVGNLVEVVYVSPFFVGQKGAVLARVDRAVDKAINRSLAMKDPSLTDHINFDEVAEVESEQTDLPGRIFNTPEEVEQIREQRARAADRAEAREQFATAQQAPAGV